MPKINRITKNLIKKYNENDTKNKMTYKNKMKKIIAKFGGICMTNSLNINKVKEIVQQNKSRKIVVVSAPGQLDNEEKITDLLYECCKQINNEKEFDKTFKKIENRFNEIIEYFNIKNFENILYEIKNQIKSNKNKDFSLSHGELLTAKISSEILHFDFVDASEIIKFKANEELDFNLTYKLIEKHLSNLGKGVVVPGFYGQNPNGEILTFSRGGSDYTASLIASGVNADVYENWKDVDGVMSCDPKIINTNYKIKEITYKELRQMSYMGSKILHPDTVLPADEKNIPIIIRNLFEPQKQGTKITNKTSLKNSNRIKEIKGKKNQVFIKIKKIMEYDEINFFYKLFKFLNSLEIKSAHFISGVDNFILSLNEAEINKNEVIFLKKIEDLNIKTISIEKEVAIITIVGNDIIFKNNIFKKIYHSLQKNDIQIFFCKIDAFGSNIMLGIKENGFKSAIIILNNLLFNNKIN